MLRAICLALLLLIGCLPAQGKVTYHGTGDFPIKVTGDLRIGGHLTVSTPVGMSGFLQGVMVFGYGGASQGARVCPRSWGAGKGGAGNGEDWVYVYIAPIMAVVTYDDLQHFKIPNDPALLTPYLGLSLQWFFYYDNPSGKLACDDFWFSAGAVYTLTY